MKRRPATRAWRSALIKLPYRCSDESPQGSPGKWIPNFANPDLMWKVMALATTLAGNLTILGSVANIIVVESARGHCEVGFWDYAKYGMPVTLLTTAAGLGILLLLG